MNRIKLSLALIILLFALNSCSKQSESLNIMSYNIRLDVKSDGINQWNNRREGIVSLIKEEKPDVFGIQEGLPHQVAYLSKQLEEYKMIGEGRNGENNGEYSAIYYKNKKLELINSETFWLSETPKKPSVGWDAALNRIATVGIFKIINSDKKTVIYNSHFDHIGKEARVNSANMILNHIKENNFSKDCIVVMGDFNSLPTHAPIKLLSENLEDSFNGSLVKKPAGKLGTFNAFDIHNKLLKRIDYIFTKNIEVVDFKHIHKKLPNGLWPSDHLPVFVTVKE
mgnify:FL=1|tara:strand:- start:57 stop:902 length:846 start_codon:yes stop_codon:yes gene_type:complete